MRMTRRGVKTVGDHGGEAGRIKRGIPSTSTSTSTSTCTHTPATPKTTATLLLLLLALLSAAALGGVLAAQHTAAAAASAAQGYYGGLALSVLPTTLQTSSYGLLIIHFTPPQTYFYFGASAPAALPPANVTVYLSTNAPRASASRRAWWYPGGSPTRWLE